MERLSSRTKRNIRAMAGSIYRMNTSTADCYAFSIIRPIVGKKYPQDFTGGYDWSKTLVDTTAEYLYMFASDKFIRIKDNREVK